MAGQRMGDGYRARLVLSAVLLAGLAGTAVRARVAESAEAALSQPGAAVAEDAAPAPARVSPGEADRAAPRPAPRRQPSPRQPSPQPPAPAAPLDEGVPPNAGLLASLFGAAPAAPPSSRLLD